MDSGIGDGPSVQGLYGPRWGQAHSEKVMYDRRKVIIDEDSEMAGRRDQHGRGGGRGRAGATARSTVAASAVSTVKPAEEICPSSSSYIKS